MPAESQDSAGGTNVLVSTDFADDAAVVRCSGGDRALVMTADVIAPLVDDPETFGRIAADQLHLRRLRDGRAAALRAQPCVLPRRQAADRGCCEAILRGGAAACAEAGVAIVGGHTVRDAEVKYGLSVTGEVTPGAILSNRGAGPGSAWC